MPRLLDKIELDVIKTVPIMTNYKDKDGSVKQRVGAEKVYYVKPNGRIGIRTINKEDTLTVQGEHDLAEIHSIVRRHTADEVNQKFVYDVDGDGVIDVAGIPDLQTHLKKVKDAELQFQNIPNRIRKKFGNDPVKFTNFCSDPDNFDALVKMGLAKLREDVKHPLQKPPVNDGSNNTDGGDTPPPTS